MSLSKRKPYVREMTASWWKKNPFYKLYIVRESTALFSIWFSLILLYGTICLTRSTNFLIGYSEFVSFLQNPLVVILNIVALGAALLNTVTYFNMTPKVMNLIVKGEKLNPKVVTGALWVVTAIVSFFALLFLFI